MPTQSNNRKFKWSTDATDAVKFLYSKETLKIMLKKYFNLTDKVIISKTF